MTSQLGSLLLFLELTRPIFVCRLHQVEMAAQFSIYNWLRAVGWSKYEKNLVEHGYDTYTSCVALSKADLRAAGVDDSDVVYLANRIEDLKAISEEDAIQKLSVSICSG